MTAELGIPVAALQAAKDSWAGRSLSHAHVLGVVGAAAPHIAAAALRQVAEEMWERTDGMSRVYSAWLRNQADLIDGRQPKPDTREGILAAAGLTEEDMAGGTDA